MQYAVLVAAVVLLIAVADLRQIQKVFFRGDLIVDTLTQGLGRALLNTVIYALGAFVLGLVLGTILALMRLSSRRPLPLDRDGIYIELFRGLPAIIVLLAFGLLPLAFPGLEIPFGIYGTVLERARHRRSGLHGRDDPRRHPGRAEGAGRGGPVARHAGRPGDAQDRAAAGVPDRHSRR